jgi:hypothetical protein
MSGGSACSRLQTGRLLIRPSEGSLRRLVRRLLAVVATTVRLVLVAAAALVITRLLRDRLGVGLIGILVAGFTAAVAVFVLADPLLRRLVGLQSAAPRRSARAACAPRERLVQSLERITIEGPENRREVARGRILMRVPAGGRIASGHVGFCPPLPSVPRVDLSAADDVIEAMPVATEVRPWGMRIECRLEEPATEEVDLAVDWQATARP